jgi:hypothetical protein
MNLEIKIKVKKKDGTWTESDDFNYLNSCSEWSNINNKELRINYRKVNSNRYKIIADSIKSLLKGVNISRDSFKLHPNNFWEFFYQLFPTSNGLITFSRIGFNEEKNEAVLYFHHGRDYLDGEGSYIFMRKINGHWKILCKARLWVS